MDLTIECFAVFNVHFEQLSFYDDSKNEPYLKSQQTQTEFFQGFDIKKESISLSYISRIF